MGAQIGAGGEIRDRAEALGCVDPSANRRALKGLGTGVIKRNVDSDIENTHEQHPHEGAVQQSKR
jgi:hypothetical protein